MQQFLYVKLNNQLNEKLTLLKSNTVVVVEKNRFKNAYQRRGGISKRKFIYNISLIPA
ncbi:hypothetical protein SAMN04488024_1237 [Pedobacter soli]|uniref:Uncharacterized protein n=1 Tax=Pedobacter soli TaxID=390242 RepID=A0A1G7D524_9SPHI|nr:hypothetical protein SAMN04488024_1237 [Pedobacter soli]